MTDSFSVRRSEQFELSLMFDYVRSAAIMKPTFEVIAL